tara:strand:+ start:4556 stop:4738 length:183 start_codon:yes stop_codon:yes gene_type:complete
MNIHDKNVHLLLTAILLNTTDPKLKAEKDKSLQALTDDYYERNLKHGKDNLQKGNAKKTT